MAKIFSRRLFVSGLTALGGGASTSAAVAKTPARSMSVTARVMWCNYRRAIVSVRADTPGASGRIVNLQRYRDEVDGDVLRKLLRPDTFVTLDLSWKPDIDPLTPWRVEAVVSAGRRLAAAQGGFDAADDMRVVIAVAAAHFGITEVDVVSYRRSRICVRARQTAMYLAHAVAGYSLSDISSAFKFPTAPVGSR